MNDRGDKSILVLGTMSGTSCDGLDLALCRIGQRGLTIELLETASKAYSMEWTGSLQCLADMEPVAVHRLEAEWTAWVLTAIRPHLDAWSDRHGFPDLLGFSGHTWYHEPGGRGTAAIGDGGWLAERLGIPVVADYRSADVAAGGQGAPLVPLFDAVAFSEQACCINLGGIANLTLLPPASKAVMAWDVAGCNLLLNRQAQRRGRACDEGGQWAAAGAVVPKALQALDQWAFLDKAPPKSLAAEDLAALHGILDAIGRPEDALATAVEWIAGTLADALKLAASSGSVTITGGGAHNLFLMERIGFHLPEGWSVHVPARPWVDGKEAAAFAWLAWRTAHRMPTSLASVTGASTDVCGGKLFGNFAPTGYESVL